MIISSYPSGWTFVVLTFIVFSLMAVVGVVGMLATLFDGRRRPSSFIYLGPQAAANLIFLAFQRMNWIFECEVCGFSVEGNAILQFIRT